MAFKDRLREEIEYQGLLVKEISAKIGIAFVRLAGLVLILVGAAYIFYAWRNRPAEQVEAEVVDDI